MVYIVITKNVVSATGGVPIRIMPSSVELEKALDRSAAMAPV